MVAVRLQTIFFLVIHLSPLHLVGSVAFQHGLVALNGGLLLSVAIFVATVD